MVRIASYTLVDRIHDGAETCIYRAVRDADRLPVILKTPNVPYPSRRQLARLQHEYAMLKKAGGRGAVLPIELLQTADVVALVTEDWGGQTLHSLIAAGALDWREAATLGLHIADALAALHDQGILHKDLKPQAVGARGLLRDSGRAAGGRSGCGRFARAVREGRAQAS